MKPHTAYLLAGLTVLAGAAVLSGLRPLMILGGLPLGLLLPGAALSALLFGRRERLAPIERIMLIPVLSLGTLVLGGLLVFLAGAPLHRVTWLALSAGVTLAGLTVVVLREHKTPAGRAASSSSAAASVREPVRPPTTDDTTPILDPPTTDGTTPIPDPPTTDDTTPILDSPTTNDTTLILDPPTTNDTTLILDPPTTNDTTPVLDRDGLFDPEAMNLRRRLLRQVLPAGLAVLMLAGAVTLSLVSSIRTHHVTVTTLSVVPPGAADSSGKRSIQVNATGLTGGSGAYKLVVTTAKGTGGTSVAVTADGAGLWTSTLRLPSDDRLTLGLYRTGATTALRTVIIASAATG